jgi:hypothetical protein
MVMKGVLIYMGEDKSIKVNDLLTKEGFANLKLTNPAANFNDISKMKLNFSLPTFAEQDEGMRLAMEETHRKREDYNQDVLNTLKNIEKNTASLAEMINLLKESNVNQTELANIISEFMVIATVKDKDKANSLYRDVMDKLKFIASDADTFTKLTKFGVMIGTILVETHIL